MNLRFMLPDYEFIEAELMCFQIIGEQDSTALSLPEIMRVRVAKGLSDQIKIQKPGTFMLTLDRLRVRSVSKGNRFVIPTLTLGWHQITSSDLESGEKTITVRPLGSLRLRAVDNSGKSIPNTTLNLFSPDWAGAMETVTNNSGEASFLFLQEGEYSVGSPSSRTRISAVIRGWQETSIVIPIEGR